MCDVSAIADDWIIKGFHVHVEDVELALRPGHKRGMIVIRAVFSSTNVADLDVAERVVRRQLDDAETRNRWAEIASRAISYLKGYNGELFDLAGGRQVELRFLERALKRYDAQLR